VEANPPDRNLLSAAQLMTTQWIRRMGTKRSGFRYVKGETTPVRAARTLARIDALRIPPAWTDVHIAPNDRAAVQAWGFDAKGRKQYRYHDRAIERGELRKHYRVRELAHDLPAIRRRVGRDFARRGLTRERVTAGVIRLISEGFFRVGSERYAKENKTFGITTLQKRHVQLEGDRAVFSYVGKRSIDQRQVIVDAKLVRFVAELARTPGRRLFRYQAASGAWADLSARDVNEYLHALVGVPYTAKDFRTWGGTLRAATVLSDIGPPKSPTDAKKNVVTAVRLVAAELGNTPTIARKSYIHPMVVSRYLDEGETIAPPHRVGNTSDQAHTVEERALIDFLNRHFPERRQAVRRARPDDATDRRASR
jgi:DNA topoisomerase-1